MKKHGILLFSIVCTILADPSIITQPPAGTFVMKQSLRGAHPRLHFTAQDIPSIRTQGLGSRKWFLDKAKQAFGGYKGKAVSVPDFSDWKNYLYGFWGQFTMDMCFLIEQDSVYANTAVNWALFYAQDTAWLKDDLIPMDIVSGMALTYDILYDRLTSSQRTILRAALKRGIDFMYPEFFIGEYWTNDFQNNHLHNRVHGFAHACFAIYGDDPAVDVQREADLAVGCFQKMIEWLPEDGSNHEGPGYWDYGNHWVVRTAGLMEHVTGVDLGAGHGHFSTDYYFRLYLTAPGWMRTLNIGDGGDGAPGNITAWVRPICEQRDPYGLAVLQELMQKNPGGFYQHVAWGLLWYDATVSPQPYRNLPLHRFWPDLEMLSVRSSWDSSATAFVFKCGPPGGHRLQQLRGTGYANVAHDHPDQNHFLLFAHGQMLAEDDGYPKEKKLTRSHNTITIDGAGQTREGSAWYQPFDYAQTGTMDDVMLSGATGYGAGNAGVLYTGAQKYVRHAAFVEGEYAIIIDDLVGAGAGDHVFEWRLHRRGVWSAGQDKGRFYVDSGGVRLDMRFLEPLPANLTSAFLPAELTAGPCLSVKTTAPSTRFTAVLVPRKGGNPEIGAELLTSSAGVAVRATLGTREDLFAVGTQSIDLQFGEVRATGAAALVRSIGSVQLALLVRGKSLSHAGQPFLAADREVNAAWRARPGGVVVEVEPPYKGSGGIVSLQVGGLAAGARHVVEVDGNSTLSAPANAQGILELTVDMTARRTIVLTSGSGGQPFRRPRARPGITLETKRSRDGIRFAVTGEVPESCVLEVFDLSGRRVWRSVRIGNAHQLLFQSRPGALDAAYIVRLVGTGPSDPESWNHTWKICGAD